MKLALVLGLMMLPCPAPAATGQPLLHDAFDADVLDEELWERTSAADFRSADLSMLPRHQAGGRLAITVDTRDTSDATVKYLGVRSRELLDFSKGLILEYELDWNAQANGCYLTAGAFLVPTETTASAEGASDWIGFQYLGVPPGRTGRAQVARRMRGSSQLLETEGWPQAEPKDRVGRALGAHRVRWEIDATTLSVSEDGREVFRGEHGLGFTKAHLHLEVSSHDNYRARTVLFDDVSVRLLP